MMYDNFVIVLSFIFPSLSIICVRVVTSQRQSWSTLTVLEDCTFLIWRRLGARVRF